MEKRKTDEDISYFTKLMVGDAEEEEAIDFNNKIILELHQMLVVMMFRFMQREVIDACKDEKNDKKEKMIRALPGHMIDGWKEKLFNQIDAEMEEFSKQKESSDFGSILGAMMGGMMNMEEMIEKRKNSITIIGDAYLDALTIKEKKEDGAAKEEG